MAPKLYQVQGRTVRGSVGAAMSRSRSPARPSGVVSMEDAVFTCSLCGRTGFWLQGPRSNLCEVCRPTARVPEWMEPVSVRVRNPAGRLMLVRLRHRLLTTIAQLKGLIGVLQGVDAQNQALTYDGYLLANDAKTLEEYGIPNGAELALLLVRH